MSSRPLLSKIAPSLRRTVVHHARPPRMPVLKTPHAQLELKPTSGTSTPHPPHLGPSEATTSSTVLEGSSLTFHHSPPPTAPSYTTGVKPELLQWVAGNPVRLSGQEGARLRRARNTSAGQVEWSEEVVGKMKEMRARGLSRREIGDALQIPQEHRHLIARAAPLTGEQAQQLSAAQDRQKSQWGARKQLNREIRERRKTFW